MNKRYEAWSMLTNGVRQSRKAGEHGAIGISNKE